MLWNAKFQPDCTNRKIFYKPHSTSEKKARLQRSILFFRSIGRDIVLVWCVQCIWNNNTKLSSYDNNANRIFFLHDFHKFIMPALILKHCGTYVQILIISVNVLSKLEKSYYFLQIYSNYSETVTMKFQHLNVLCPEKWIGKSYGVEGLTGGMTAHTCSLGQEVPSKW